MKTTILLVIAAVMLAGCESPQHASRWDAARYGAVASSAPAVLSELD